ncbi:MAG TPA: hypothetical protein VFW56_11940 [Bradyrhizobium sp.]|nr:hypothetical protein [Bradyrhizobium sp.]
MLLCGNTAPAVGRRRRIASSDDGIEFLVDGFTQTFAPTTGWAINLLTLLIISRFRSSAMPSTGNAIRSPQNIRLDGMKPYKIERWIKLFRRSMRRAAGKPVAKIIARNAMRIA